MRRNASELERKHLYIGYTPRWMKQRGILAPDPKLLAHSSPIRRQLLGGMGDNSHPLGSNPEAGPISQFW